MNTTTDRGPPWTDAGIAKLREILLEDAMERVARYRTPIPERAELMAWFGSDHLAPLRFCVCAASCGLDHEALREGLLAVLSEQDSEPEALPTAA
jgi:hypothetical protein